MKYIVCVLFLLFSSLSFGENRKTKDILDVNSIPNKFLDIPYGNLSKSQKLDIYIPEGKGPFPTIIFIHGGAWMRGDKREQLTAPILEALKRGYVAVSINYRLSNEAPFPAAIEDAKTSIRFLRANASKFSIDPNKIAVFGRSAGSNLASLIGTTSGSKTFDNPKLGYNNFSSSVSAVVALYTPCNLLSMDDQLKDLDLKAEVRTPDGATSHGDAKSPASKYMGAKISTVPDKVKANNPETYISENTPPFFVSHGTMDKSVPFTQSVVFVNELHQKSKNKVVFMPVIGARHGDPIFFTPKYMTPMFDFLDSIMK